MALYEGFDMTFVKMPKYLATNKYQNKDVNFAALTPRPVGVILCLARYPVRGEVWPGAVFDRTFDRTVFLFNKKSVPLFGKSFCLKVRGFSIFTCGFCSKINVQPFDSCY